MTSIFEDVLGNQFLTIQVNKLLQILRFNGILVNSF